MGGGPAGMMLSVLLARAGIDVTVLEKYGDFFRDFRGDTIHPSTLELLYELGWLDDFLKIRHDELGTLDANIGGETIPMADFSRLPTRCKFIAVMPQWDFLSFLADRGRAYPGFHLEMQTEAFDLAERDGRFCGVRARGPAGDVAIEAGLVIGTDGRHSTIRERAGLKVDELGAPMDVLWMRIPQAPGDPPQALGNLVDGKMLVMIDRHDYWQCAYLIPKGSFDRLKASGIESLQRALAAVAPALRDRVGVIDDWSKVSLLEVRVDRLERWHLPGLLCIGDAAHAMSPIGGVGINLAIQDAVATANELAAPLMRGETIGEDSLARIQHRRTFPTRITQAFQVFVQNHAIEPLLGGAKVTSLPLALRLFNEFPGLRGLPARLIGIGARPERIRTPAV